MSASSSRVARAAVAESVALAREFGHRGTAALVNAVMRQAATRPVYTWLPPADADRATSLAVEYSHPRWLVKRWLDRFGLERTRTLLAVNNEPANPLETPLNIVAEWYLLPFYAILKTVPSKLGGVVALATAIFSIGLIPVLDRSKVRSARYRPVKRVLTWIFFVDFVLLGYVGKYQPNAISFLGVRMHTLGVFAASYYLLYFITMPIISYYEPVRTPAGEFLSAEEKED